MSVASANLQKRVADKEAAAAAAAQPLEVFLRVRPFTSTEEAVGATSVVEHVNDKTVKVTAPTDSAAAKSGDSSATFQFTGVLPQSADQEKVYDTVLREKVAAAVQDGKNLLVFAYGMTNAGKTYTVSGSDESPGLLPRTLQQVFASASGPDSDLHVTVSYMEIYNELIYDLLSTHSANARGAAAPRPRMALKARLGRDGRAYVRGLRTVSATGLEGALGLMAEGGRNKATAETLMNADSSRSHTVFTITVYKRTPVSEEVPVDVASAGADATTDSAGVGDGSAALGASGGLAGMRLFSRLSVVDLAGSERASRTQAQGRRLREAGRINNSLSVLGRCLDVMRANTCALAKAGADSSSSLARVPWRESKLTEVFADMLGGSGTGATVMMLNAGPSAKDYDETLHALRYGCKAGEIKVGGGNAVSRVSSRWAPGQYGYDGRRKRPAGTRASEAGVAGDKPEGGRKRGRSSVAATAGPAARADGEEDAGASDTGTLPAPAPTRPPMHPIAALTTGGATPGKRPTGTPNRSRPPPTPSSSKRVGLAPIRDDAPLPVAEPGVMLTTAEQDHLLAEAAAARRSLQLQVEALQGQVADLSAENTELRETNEALDSDVQRLQLDLDNQEMALRAELAEEFSAMQAEQVADSEEVVAQVAEEAQTRGAAMGQLTARKVQTGRKRRRRAAAAAAAAELAFEDNRASLLPGGLAGPGSDDEEGASGAAHAGVSFAPPHSAEALGGGAPRGGRRGSSMGGASTSSAASDDSTVRDLSMRLAEAEAEVTREKSRRTEEVADWKQQVAGLQAALKLARGQAADAAAAAATATEKVREAQDLADDAVEKAEKAEYDLVEQRMELEEQLAVALGTVRTLETELQAVRAAAPASAPVPAAAVAVDEHDLSVVSIPAEQAVGSSASGPDSTQASTEEPPTQPEHDSEGDDLASPPKIARTDTLESDVDSMGVPDSPTPVVRPPPQAKASKGAAARRTSSRPSKGGRTRKSTRGSTTGRPTRASSVLGVVPPLPTSPGADSDEEGAFQPSAQAGALLSQDDDGDALLTDDENTEPAVVSAAPKGKGGKGGSRSKAAAAAPKAAPKRRSSRRAASNAAKHIKELATLNV